MYGSIEVKTIQVDFTDGVSIYPKIRKELEKMDIGVLVNNVGMTMDFDQPFHTVLSEQQIQDVINCNCMSMARMLHIVLPGMVERRRGIVMNVGSLASAKFLPVSHLYGATKVE